MNASAWKNVAGAMALAVGVLGSNTAGAGGISLYEVGSFNSVDRFFFAANLNWKF